MTREPELNGVFEEGEFGIRCDPPPRDWHTQFFKKREESIAAHDRGSGQHAFNLYAGTGAGKTFALGWAAAADLNAGRARRIVCVVPSVIIAQNIHEEFRNRFGIHLAFFNARNHKQGVTSNWQGYIVTMQGVQKRASTHLRISRYEPTTVIIDEIHHLGEGESYGEATQLAFGACPYVIGSSGSPFRPKNGFIPFARYVSTDRPDVLRYEADYSYSLGRAILDGYCREPDFRFSDDAVVEIRPAGSDRSFSISFKDEVSEHYANLRLGAAVRYDSVPRKAFLRRALAEIRAAGRKVIIFVGGETVDGIKPTDDARHLLPDQLVEMGYTREEIAVLTEEDKRPHEKLRQFRESPTAWIMITVNRLSEGANTPEVSAAIFLSNWTTDLSLIQRIGRALRYRGKGDHPDAWIYMFSHPRHHAVAIGIKEEMKAEAARRQARCREAGGDRPGPPRRTEAIAISGGEITHCVWNGDPYPALDYYAGLEICQARNISKAFLSDVIASMRKGREHGDGGSGKQSA